MSGLLILALETSGATGSVALARGGRVLARRFLDERGRHAAALPGAISTVLAEAGLPAAKVNRVAVGSGPGSFTGVRVAGAAANGFAHALGLPVVPVSSLAAAALTAHVLPNGVGPWSGGAPRGRAPGAGEPVRVLFDARGERLFTAVYTVTPDGLVEKECPRFSVLSEILDGPGPRLACGDGARRHAESLAGAGIEVMPLPAGVPTADGVVASLERGVCGTAGPAGSWEPEYLRETGAVRARVRKGR